MRKPGIGVVAAFAAIGWLPRVGCHEVAEYESYGSFGVGVLDLPGLTQEEPVIEGFEGGRCICSMGADEFLVACTTGQVYLGDTDEMAVTAVHTVGQPFSSGYHDMIYASNHVAYLIGDYGQLIEFAPSSGVVIDEFSAGPRPSCLSLSVRPDRFFVGDGLDDRLREVAIPENLVVRDRILLSPPGSISRVFDQESMLVVVSQEEDGWRYLIDAGAVLYPWEYEGLEAGSDVAALDDSILYCVANPGYGSPAGNAEIVAFSHFPDTMRTTRLDLDGHPTRVAWVPETGTFYVSSPLGNGYSRIYAIDCLTATITASIDVEGYVWDIAPHAFGEQLLYLTSSE
jgi:hypothetical protein